VNENRIEMGQVVVHVAASNNLSLTYLAYPFAERIFFELWALTRGSENEYYTDMYTVPIDTNKWKLFKWKENVQDFFSPEAPVKYKWKTVKISSLLHGTNEKF
jgi:hypothetical protein